MALNRGTFVRNVSTVGTTPIEARLALAGSYAENSPGVPRSGVVFGAAPNLVTGNGSTMSYDIAPCEIVIYRAAGEGVYVMTITGATNIETGAAPGSGSRFDLIYVKQNDPDKADPDNAPVLGVVQGTSSTGTPTKPYASVPAGAYVLAEAQIFSGTTFASGGTNTMAQVFRWTVARGAAIPVRNSTELGEITPFDGAQVLRLDYGGRPVQTYSANSSNWYPLELTPIAPSGWAVTGSINVIPMGARKRVLGVVHVNRTGGTFSAASGSYTAIGGSGTQIIPSSAISSSGESYYIAGVVTGASLNVKGIIFLNGGNGSISFMPDATFNWAAGGFFDLLLDYTI